MHLIRHKQVAFAALNNALRLHLHFIYIPMKIILSNNLHKMTYPFLNTWVIIYFSPIIKTRIATIAVNLQSACTYKS